MRAETKAAAGSDRHLDVRCERLAAHSIASGAAAEQAQTCTGATVQHTPACPDSFQFVSDVHFPNTPPSVLTICWWRLSERAHAATGHMGGYFGQRDALLPGPQHWQLPCQLIFQRTIRTITNNDTRGARSAF